MVKYTGEVLWYTKIINYLVKRLKYKQSCLNWNCYFMVPSIVVLGTQILKIKMKSPKIIIKSITQKVMASYSFEV